MTAPQQLFTIILILGATAVVPAQAKEQRLLVVGDSIGAGYGLSSSQKSWVDLLSDYFEPYDWTVINASVSGDTTTDALRKIHRLLENYQPEYVVVELGGNDALRATPIHLIADNLNRIIRSSQRQGAMTLLIGVTLPPNYGQRYIKRFEKMYREVAENTQSLFVSFAHTEIGTDAKYLQFDRIHPNHLAQPFLFEAVKKPLKAELYLP
ncbi:MAG: arylesterase [Gammaproteobacteria bacterium]